MGGGRNCILSTNAIQFRQKIRSIGALDLTDKKFWTTKNKYFLKIAVYYEIHLWQTDLDYINNKICRDDLFGLIIPQLELGSPHNILNSIEFYERFFNDPQIPTGVEKILSIDTANKKGSATPEKTKIINYRRPYIELWFEIVNLTR